MSETGLVVMNMSPYCTPIRKDMSFSLSVRLICSFCFAFHLVTVVCYHDLHSCVSFYKQLLFHLLPQVADKTRIECHLVNHAVSRMMDFLHLSAYF